MTSLVHEAYFRLARPDALRMNDRAHFYAIAARAMRQLVIDHARQRIAGKRGGGEAMLELDSQVACNDRDTELLARSRDARSDSRRVLVKVDEIK